MTPSVSEIDIARSDSKTQSDHGHSQYTQSAVLKTSFTTFPYILKQCETGNENNNSDWLSHEHVVVPARAHLVCCGQTAHTRAGPSCIVETSTYCHSVRYAGHASVCAVHLHHTDNFGTELIHLCSSWVAVPELPLIVTRYSCPCSKPCEREALDIWESGASVSSDIACYVELS
jgi:hypothetical protein